MFIMEIHLRGIIECVNRSSWYNSRVLRLGFRRNDICGYHNLTCEKHTDAKKDALSYFSALKPILIRNESTIQSAEDTDTTPKDYRMLYRFPHITLGGFVNKIKKHFTIVMAVGVPTTYLLRLMEVISTDTFLFFISQGGVMCCILYSVGMIFYKLVGCVYLSSDGSTVKISYLDFWGRRVDVCCPLTDIVPFSDLSERMTDVYVNLRRYSSPQKLHIALYFGGILDTKLFTDVFGESV